MGGRTPLFGGEEDGAALRPNDVEAFLADALKTYLYNRLEHREFRLAPDRAYADNRSFWLDALGYQHFPSTYCILEDFTLTEWLPFSPGRFFTESAHQAREYAERFITDNGREYLPNGKLSMVKGGIGCIRLAERSVRGSTLFFLGASSSGVAHEGIPIAISLEEYRKVIEPIRESGGGCRARIVGTLSSLTPEMPQLNFDTNLPRYCLHAVEVVPNGKAVGAPTVTVAAMFTSKNKSDGSSGYNRLGSRELIQKSWTFCTLKPDRMGLANSQAAAEWLFQYASRYSEGEGPPNILTDFDEHYRAFPCSVEFPLSDILNGAVDWNTLNRYAPYGGAYIENYFREVTVMGDSINVSGSGNVLINRSTVENAFNRVKREQDAETAQALKIIAEKINQSSNKEAAENFESFAAELAKREPKKSILKSLWQGTLAALPTLMQIPDAVEKVKGLLS
jgi:hypothetical protein